MLFFPCSEDNATIASRRQRFRIWLQKNDAKSFRLLPQAAYRHIVVSGIDETPGKRRTSISRACNLTGYSAGSEHHSDNEYRLCPITGDQWLDSRAYNGSSRSSRGRSYCQNRKRRHGDQPIFRYRKNGYYVFPNLPIGSYTVTIRKEGFETERHPGVVLDAGLEATIDSQLKVGSVATAVEVTGGAPIVDPSRVSTGRTISHEETDNLPLHRGTLITSSSSNPASADIRIRSWAFRDCSTQTAYPIASIISWMARQRRNRIGTGCACSPSPTAT